MCPYCKKSDTFYNTKGSNALHLKPCDKRIYIYVYKDNKLELSGSGRKENIPKRNVYLCYECNKEVELKNGCLIKK